MIKFIIVSKNIKKYYKNYNKNIKNTINAINKFLVFKIVFNHIIAKIVLIPVYTTINQNIFDKKNQNIFFHRIETTPFCHKYKT